MNDRELLEMAARAAGVEGGWGPVFKIGDDEVDVSDIWFLDAPETGSIWEPLTDDGDALRLAVTLYLDVCFYKGFEEVVVQGDRTKDTPTSLGEILEISEPFCCDMAAATRRAIVRAAAEIGRELP